MAHKYPLDVLLMLVHSSTMVDACALVLVETLEDYRLRNVCHQWEIITRADTYMIIGRRVTTDAHKGNGCL